MVTVLLIIIYTDTIWDEWKKKKEEIEAHELFLLTFILYTLIVKNEWVVNTFFFLQKQK